jgi:hypothetical protein
MADNSYRDISRLEDSWRDKVDEAFRRHSESPTPEMRDELTRALRIFADLVMRRQLPPCE